MHYKAPIDREKLITKLKAKGLTNAEIQYYLNHSEKRDDLAMSHKEVHYLKKIIQHNEETVQETSTFDPTRVVATRRKNDGTVSKTVVRKDLVKKKEPGMTQEELDAYIDALSKDGFNEDEISHLVSQLDEQKIDRRKVGKVKLTPGKPMSKKDYATLKSRAMSKKTKIKPKPKSEEQKKEELTGLDLITQHPMSKVIRSTLSNIPKTAHKEQAVKWLISAIKDHKDNHVQAFVNNPFETMASIMRTNSAKQKKAGPSLPKITGMDQ